MKRTPLDRLRRWSGDRCEYCRIPRRFDPLPFQMDHIIAQLTTKGTKDTNKTPRPRIKEVSRWTLHDAQFSTTGPGTDARSLSADTTVQLPSGGDGGDHDVHRLHRTSHPPQLCRDAPIFERRRL